jgi:hypothetical protein
LLEFVLGHGIAVWCQNPILTGKGQVVRFCKP